MPSSNAGDAESGLVLAHLLEVIFSLTFPLAFITLCAVSYVLVYVEHMPEFGFWFALANWALGQAQTNTWWMVGLWAFALSALPFAWVSLREQEVKASNAIGAYVTAGIFIAFIVWLRAVWPFDRSSLQVIAYNALLFFAWLAVVEAALVTLGIVFGARASRPRKSKPPREQPHGVPDARSSRGGPETI